MTATVTRIRRSYPRPGTLASNEPKYPTDSPNKSVQDKALVLTVWVAGIFGSLAVIAGLAKLVGYLARLA